MKKNLLVLILALCSLLTTAQVTITVNVTTAGSFSTALTSAGGNASTVTNLVVTGNIDARDIQFMRDNMPVLAVLDLEAVQIMAYNTYPANQMPGYSFYNSSSGVGKTSLTSIKLPNSITSIGNNAFQMCSNISGTLVIPASVTSIGNIAFYGCNGLTGNLTIPDFVTSIGMYAFAYCGGLKGNLTIPNSVVSIGARSFMNSAFTGNLTIPNSVTSIGENAFSSCSGFTGNLTIPNSVTSMGEDAFYGCVGFTGGLTISTSLTSIEKYTFYNCIGLTGSLSIPNSVTSIGDAAFSGCKGLTGSLAIPDQITSIGNDAFFNCKGLISLSMSEPLTSIGSNAFSNCSSITGDLTIPNTVNSIGEGAFAACNLNSFNINNSYYSTVDGVLFNSSKTILIQCPTGKIGPYTIPISVTSIGLKAFSGCSKLTGSLAIPNSVTSIGVEAFSGCSGFTGNLTIPNSVASIGGNTFYNCSGLTGNLIIPNSVTSIGGNAFYKCTGFTGNLTIPNSVISIGYNAFLGCSGLTGNLAIPNSVTSIGRQAFSGCKGFTGNLTIPNSITTIEEYVFDGCIGLTGKLTIPNSVSSINRGAFYGCIGITGISLSVSVTSMGTYTFYGCTGLQKIIVTSATPLTIDPSTFVNVNKTTCQLYVPFGAKSAYQSANVWKDFVNIIEGWVVHYDLQGGSNISDTIVQNNITLPFPKDPVKTGYKFTGWFKEAGYINAWGFASDVITTNTTLYAKWTIIDYLVSFNSQGGSTIPGITAHYGQTIAESAPPIRAGYNFDGWYSDAAYNNSWFFDEDGWGNVITSDTTLYAKWIKNFCTVSFDSKGGSLVAGFNSNFNTQITAPTAPTKAGYAFEGWYKDAACTNIWDFATDVVISDTTLYAKWAATPTSVDTQNSTSITLFPNPATRFVQIAGKKLESVSSFNLAGTYQSEIKLHGEDSFTMNIENLVPGFYVIVIRSDHGSVSMFKLKKE